jgi:hypothetical protein
VKERTDEPGSDPRLLVNIFGGARMKLIRATLNGGAGMVVHVVDKEQRMGPGHRRMEALCGRIPGGGTTNMGARRSRWRQVGICPTDSPEINCEKCRKKLAEHGIVAEDVTA